ncbi:MAG TPA: tetratricopeptide repeat protein, partial [Longimicrobiales bacterium]|nr:tetratricopeptide repeat protein [Longimicrobiales bacterium]
YRTGDGLRDAICFFRAATDRDHDYALAWAGLAQALTLSHSYGYADDPAVLAEAEEAARWALELDPELPEAHAAAMLLHDTRSEGPAAIRALHRAVNLRPGYADAYNWLSWLYALTGRPQEVLESARRAARLNPMSPDVASKVVLGHLVNRNLAEAVREARRVQEIAPEYTIGRFYEGLALYEQRRFGDAMAALEDLHEAWAGHGAEATYALACLGMGQERAAREWRTKLRELEDHFAVGLLEGARGHADRARPAFDRADVGSYWPVLAVHYLYRDVWARLPEDLHDGLRRRVNAAWGLDADGHFPAPPRPPLPLST